MIHTKKPIPVSLLKLVNGKYLVTDRFDKCEVLSQEELYRYVDSKVTEARATPPDAKSTIAQAVNHLQMGEADEALRLLEQLL